MFNPLKQAGELKKLRDEAKKIERELEQIEVTEEERGVKVTVTGNMKVVSIEVDGEEKRDIAETVNDAIKEAQKKAAMKMSQMGGGLRGLLGGS